MKKLDIGSWGEHTIKPGSRKRLRLDIGRSFSGAHIHLPLMVWRAAEPGPTVAITAAVHGDEINGTGVIRRLIQEKAIELKRGALILVPVINVLGFERHSRYMPDRRDLNRSFPGSVKGSLSARLADLVFSEVIARSDYLVDLHTAAVRRTNFPNVRADCRNEDCLRMARAFGCEIIVDNTGPEGSLRKEAVKAGVPCIILEAGEVWKAEPSVQELTLRGIDNVLAELGLTDTEAEPPHHQLIVKETAWIRAETEGFLEFHVAPGDTVSADQALATNATLLGTEKEIIRSSVQGVLLGMTTMPAVSPGDPVAHIGVPSTDRQHQKLEKSIDKLEDDAIEVQLREHLATNIVVTVMDEEP
jgi:predicted deacylase